MYFENPIQLDQQLSRKQDRPSGPLQEVGAYKNQTTGHLSQVELIDNLLFERE